MILYLDSSALLRRYLNQAGGPEIDQVLGADHVYGTSSVTRIEIAASLTRLARGGTLRELAADAAIAQLEVDILAMWEVPVNGLVVRCGYDLARKHRLKGYDCVQLAAAISFRSALAANPVVFATFDRQLWSAAQAEDFTPWPSDLQLFR